MVYPSAGARAIASWPTTPEPPVRFTTLNGCFSSFSISAPMMRAVASVPPPAPQGTMSWTGRCGYWAWTSVAAAASAAAKSVLLMTLLPRLSDNHSKCPDYLFGEPHCLERHAEIPVRLLHEARREGGIGPHHTEAAARHEFLVVSGVVGPLQRDDQRPVHVGGNSLRGGDDPPGGDLPVAPQLLLQRR